MSIASSYEGRRVLITGGVGFIGSNLAIRLVELGAKVVLVDSMIPAYGANIANVEPVRQRVRINYSDIRDARSLSYLVQDEAIIFSLAGQVSHSESMDDPMTDLEINCASQRPVFGPPVRPTWWWPKPDQTFFAASKFPINGSESLVDGRCPIHSSIRS